MIKAFADVYRDAALSNMNMIEVADTIETIRTRFQQTKKLFKAWDCIDEHIARAESKEFRLILKNLRNRFERHLFESEIERLQKAFKEDSEDGWNEYIESYATALSRWRVTLCSAISEEQFEFSSERIEEAEKIKHATSLILHGRWSETYDLFIHLSNQKHISKITRAKLLVIAGQILLYHCWSSHQAMALFEKAKKLAPKEGIVKSAFGEYLIQQHDIVGAKEVFQEIIETNPDYAPAYSYMAECYESENNLSVAEEWYQEAILRTTDNSTSAHRKLINLYGHPTRIGTDMPKIKSLVKLILDIDPNDEYITYLTVGFAFRNNQQYGECHKWYDKAIQLDPQRLMGLVWKGYAYLDDNNYEESHASFKEAIELAPESMDGYYGMAGVFEFEEKWEKALEWYKKCIRVARKSLTAITTKIAEIQFKLGYRGQSEEQIIDLLRADPESEFTLNSAIRMTIDSYKKYDDPEQSLRILDKIREIRGAKFDHDYWNRVGNLKYWYRNYEEAASEYKKAIDAKPNDAVYHANRSGAFRELGQWESAFEEIETAISLDSKYISKMAKLYNEWGNTLYSQSDYESAIEKYKMAIQLNQNNATYLSNLSRAWEHVKKVGERRIALNHALDAIQKAYELEPQSKEYLHSQIRLEKLKPFADKYGGQVIDLLPVVTPIAIETASDILPYIEDVNDNLAPNISEHVTKMRERLQSQFGIRIPGVRFRELWTDVAKGKYNILLWENLVATGTVVAHKRFLDSSSEELHQMELHGEPGWDPLTGNSGLWIDESDCEELEKRGYQLFGCDEFIVRHLELTLQEGLSDFVGHQEATDILQAKLPEAYEAFHGGKIDLGALTSILRSLLRERVPILEIDAIFETFCSKMETQSEISTIIEDIRSLPEVRPNLWGNSEDYSPYRIGPRLASELESSILKNQGKLGRYLEPEKLQEIRTAIRYSMSFIPNAALVVEDAELRPILRRMIELEFSHIPVLSFGELSENMRTRARGSFEVEL
ncbi:MAG: FHIPEP family type III secretion protein [Candidatus Thorarchaeota archaeon]|jgi:tetratricopeptide (TPR) repeat protein